MFAVHQRRIGAWARLSADNFAQVILFVVLTIRTPLHRVPDDMAETMRRGLKAVPLWGWKADAYRYLKRHKATLYDRCEEIWNSPLSPDDQADRLIETLVAVPGLGMVKAGFVAQLVYGVSGCIDTHNLERFGIPPRTFRYETYARGSEAKRKRWIRYYNETVERLGGTQQLWDSWCHHVAKEQPTLYRDAEYVSRLHCDALGL